MNPTETLSSNSGAVAASRIVKAGLGRIFTATFTNTSNADRYYQLFDSLTLPADTAVPLVSVKCPAGGTVSMDFSFWGRLCLLGIVLVSSSTQATKTITAADALIDATYV